MSNKIKQSLLVAACGLATALATPLVQAAEKERYIVKFVPGKGKAAAALVARSGGEVKRNLARHDAFAISLPPQALKGLSNNPNIEFIEIDAKRYPLAQTVPYGIPMVQADQLSDGTTGNRTVCIIDSGYDLAHEDLAGNNVSGTNDPGTGNWYEDENHHGTHVAGTIAALNNDTGVVGVNANGNLNLHIVKVFGADGWAYSSSLVDALDVCTANGADVINMSLGGSQKSRLEDRAFAAAYNNGVLNIAAAGNDGNTRHSYPASYDSVVSVAAIDENKVVASFSQQTSQVELAGPGVGVLSTVPMNSGSSSVLTVSGATVESLGMDGSPIGSASGALVDCGIGDSACTAAAGAVCLIQRGSISFADKVVNCEAGGGLAAIIYNNEAGVLSGTLGGTATGIPSVGISDTAGAALLGQLGSTAEVALEPSSYAYFDGTSMATPHVAGVAALVWSQAETCAPGEIRLALRESAEDLGTAGRDDAYGYGLIQASDAVALLNAKGCTGVNPDLGGRKGGGKSGGACKGNPRNCN